VPDLPQPRARWRRHVSDAGRSFAINVASPNLRRAQLSFAFAWTGEWVVMVAISVVAYSLGREAFLAAVGGPSACRAAAEQLAADRIDANATPRSPS
jgi:hypothetical protein